MGEFEKGIIKQLNRQGKPLPDKIANAPMLEVGLSLYWDAFLLLCSERNGENSLPWRAMQSYVDELGITDLDDRADFYFIMREMDLKLTDITSKKRNKLKETGKSSKVKGKSGVQRKG